MKRATIFAIGVLLLYAVVIHAQATTITVTNTNDSGPGSLRQALADASDGDTVDATDVSGTILLTSGELQINHNVTINGPGAGYLAVNGDATFGVFENLASDVTMSGFTITNGNASNSGTQGGGILNLGGLTLSGSRIVHNTAFQGGGIFNGGALTISDSSIVSNNAPSSPPFLSYGGGIGNDNYGGTLTVTNSTISGNSAAGVGGGIFGGDSSQTQVINSVINGNSAITGNSSGGGGGIGNESYGGTMTVTNSTISGNSADGVGGGIWNVGTTIVTNSTISANSAPTGGGILNDNGAQIGDTVLNAGAGGTIANRGTFTSIGYNLASDDGGGVLTGPGDQINTDPMLGPLQNNGGPTLTHALLPGSPAINAGDPNFTPPPFYDQRGAPSVRVFNGRLDIGSFELQPPPRPSPTPRSRPTPPPRPTPSGSFRALHLTNR